MVQLLPLIGTAIDRIFKVVDKAVQDKDLAAKLKHEIQLVMLNLQSQALKAQADIIIAEARGESWLQRSWRPLVMLMFAAMITWNGMLVPILAGFGIKLAPVNLQGIPAELWNLLKIGLGGYLGLRSAEKITHTVVVGRQITKAIKQIPNQVRDSGSETAEM